MKSTKRAQRIHHKKRLIKRAKSIVRRWYHDTDNRSADDLADAQARRIVDHMKCTQCKCCSNPRRSYGDQTRAEDRADIDFKEQTDDLK